MTIPGADFKAAVGGRTIYGIESRKSLEFDLSDLTVAGSLDIFPQVEDRGLLFLQFRRRRVVVSAGPYVGLIPLTPHISIDVRPRLPVSNLARVLEAARGSLKSIQGVDRLYLTAGAAGDSILEFLIRNLVDSVRPILTNGLYRKFVRDSEVTSIPRGRILLGGTVRSWARGQRHQVHSQRFEQSTDISINRTIKEALQFALRQFRPIDKQGRKLVREANANLMELPATIGALRPGDLAECGRTIESRILPISRSYYYRPAEIACLILSRGAISLDKPGKDIELASFILNFEDLFEAYLRRVLADHVPTDVAVLDGNQEGKRLLFADANVHLAQPDIVLNRGGQNAIVEVKYKARPNREDINQAITYAICYGASRVAIAHQWPQTGPKGSYAIGTIAGIELSAYAFDLASENLDVEEAAFTTSSLNLLPAADPLEIAA
jgi:5-methylcytosine-specific restriction enzyme subunit McrC